MGSEQPCRGKNGLLLPCEDAFVGEDPIVDIMGVRQVRLFRSGDHTHDTSLLFVALNIVIL